MQTMDFSVSLSEWAKDKPLSILQLDPADRAVLKIADERDAIQKKTFTKWLNKHLKKTNHHVDDLFEDLRDGHNLLSLLEVLSGELLPRERGRLRFHQLQNVQEALEYLRRRKIKLVNIRPEDIVDGNPKLTLGLIWTIILHFQISDIITGLTDETVTARDALLKWAQRTTERYPGVKVTDFTSSWKDGLAFSAILHRNKPDLLDFKSLRTRSAKDNLELAFSAAEKEFGITRLLDPEDVDTPEPDEKSIITYISSMYDVFPEPPHYHPFADDEKNRKVEEYKEIARSLQQWMKMSLEMLKSKKFSSSLIDMKTLLSESSKFRTEEIPKRLRDKQRLSHLHRDIQKICRDSGHFELEKDLKLEEIEKNWNNVMSALQERDQKIRDEICSLEKLQRLAEKLNRECKQCDVKIDDIERKIKEEEKRVQRLHPVDIKHNCDQIESDLKHIDDLLKSLKKDVVLLEERKYHQVCEIKFRIESLIEKYLSLKTMFQTKLLVQLTMKSEKTIEEKKVKQKVVTSEQKIIDSNKVFPSLKEHLDWVEKKQKRVNQIEFGNDLQSIKTNCEQIKQENKHIEQYKKKIDQCSSQKNSLKGNDLFSYSENLAVIEKAYKELTASSTQKQKDMESLLDFVQSATKELKWMNDKEEVEVARDWSAKNLNLVDLEHHQETLTNDLEKREIQFNAIQNRGESLLLQNHPASQCIENYLTNMQSQWSWLLQLTLCLEIHLRNAQAYHQFFKEARECDQWIKKTEEKLNTTFSKNIFSVDEGEQYLKQMQELKSDLTRYNDIIVRVVEHSSEIVPLKSRRVQLSKPVNVVAICKYKTSNVVISKDDKCTLRDNSQRVMWKVVTPSGSEGSVPSVCFIIPSPSHEAVELGISLKKRYDELLKLWNSKEKRLRQNLILATVKVVKSWDITQFRSMDATQRDSIIQALNADAEKLLTEGSSSEPALVKLKEEMTNCNALFKSMLQKMADDETEKSAKSSPKKLSESIASLQITLNEKEKMLRNKLQAAIVWNIDSLENFVLEHKDFEISLRSLEDQIKDVTDTFKTSTRKAPLQSKYDTLIQTWEKIWSLSNTYVEKLKTVEVALHRLNDASQTVSSIEVQLSSCDNLSSDIGDLQKLHEKLLSFQAEIQQSQNVIDDLQDSVKKLKALVQRTRSKQATHSDVNKFENDVDKLTTRWDNARSQIVERLRSCGGSSELLRSYKSQMDKDNIWITETTVKVNNVKTVKRMTTKEIEMTVEPTMNLYSSIAERSSSIEETNVLGARYIREAKIYDLRLKHYTEKLEEDHPSLDASLQKKAATLSGADVVAKELENLNNKYLYITQSILKYLQELKEVLSREQKERWLSVINQVGPISLKTYDAVLEQIPSLGTTPIQNGNNYDKMSSITSVVYGTSAATQEPVTPQMEQNLSELQSDVNISHMQNVKVIEQISDLSQDGSLISVDELETQDICTAKGIFNPKSNRNLTLQEALMHGILNFDTKEFIDLRTGRQLSLQESVTKGFIDKMFYDRLSCKCGIYFPGSKEELSLMEAIQKNLYDVKSGSLVNPQDGKLISLTDAFHLGIIKKSGIKTLINMKIIKTRNLSLVDAVQKEFLDPNTGMFRDPLTNTTMPLKEAVEKGFIKTELRAEPVSGITLAEAINRGIFQDHSGQILDEDSGEKYTLDEALCNGILRGDIPEIIDIKKGNILTLEQALLHGVVNARNGRYTDSLTSKEYTFTEAQRKSLILQPLSLIDALEKDIINEGFITDPVTGDTISIIQALHRGVLDSESKCIVDSQSGEMLSLLEALTKGVILPNGTYFDTELQKEIPLSYAIDKGLITSVEHKMIFDVECVQDILSTETVSFNTALERKLIDLDNEQFINNASGEKLSLEEAVSHGFIQPQIYGMFCKPIGIKKDEKELNLIQSWKEGYIDGRTGRLKDPNSKRTLYLKDAIEKGVISNEGAMLLKSLLNISVTKAVITTTSTIIHDEHDNLINSSASASGISNNNISEFEKYASKELSQFYTTVSDAQSPAIESKFSEHLDAHIAKSQTCEGLIGKEKFHDFDNSLMSHKKTVPENMPPKNDVICHEESDRITSVNVCEPSKMIAKQFSLTKIEVNGNKIASREGDSALVGDKHLFSYAHDPKTYKDNELFHGNSLEDVQVTELPTDGWFLIDAINQNLFDPDTGLFIVPGTDRLLSFEEAIKMEIIDPKSALVLDQNTNQRVTLDVALEVCILDSTGHYIETKTFSKIPMHKAIESNYITLFAKFDGETDASQKIVMQDVKNELRYVDNVRTLENLNENSIIAGNLNTLRVETIVLQKIPKKMITLKDAAKEGFIDIETADAVYSILNGGAKGKDVNLQALENVSINDTKILDVRKGYFISLKEAFNTDLIDKSTGQMLVPLGHCLSIPEAYERGLFDELSQRIVHPETGELLTVEEAIMCEIINPCSCFIDPKTKLKVTIDDGIKEGVIDSSRGKIVRPKRCLSLAEGVHENIFVPFDGTFHKLPPLSLTFPVALQRKCIDVHKKEFIHPTTKKCMPLQHAFDSGALMIIPAHPQREYFLLDDALSRKLIDPVKCTFKHPVTSQIIHIKEAMKSGLLIVKPLRFTSSPSPTSDYNKFKTEILICEEKNIKENYEIEKRKHGNMTFTDAVNSGLLDIDSGTFYDTTSNTYIPVSEALRQQIIQPLEGTLESSPGQKDSISQVFLKHYNEKTEMFSLPDGKNDVTFDHLIKEGYVDLKSLIYDAQENRVISTEDALNQNIIDSETGHYVFKGNGKRITVMEAAKLGLLAFIGAPVLAVSSLVKKSQDITFERSTKHDSVQYPTNKCSKPLSVASDFGASSVRPSSLPIEVTSRVSQNDAYSIKETSNTAFDNSQNSKKQQAPLIKAEFERHDIIKTFPENTSFTELEELSFPGGISSTENVDFTHIVQSSSFINALKKENLSKMPECALNKSETPEILAAQSEVKEETLPSDQFSTKISSIKILTTGVRQPDASSIQMADINFNEEINSTFQKPCTTDHVICFSTKHDEIDLGKNSQLEYNVPGRAEMAMKSAGLPNATKPHDLTFAVDGNLEASGKLEFSIAEPRESHINVPGVATGDVYFEKESVELTPSYTFNEAIQTNEEISPFIEKMPTALQSSVESSKLTLMEINRKEDNVHIPETHYTSMSKSVKEDTHSTKQTDDNLIRNVSIKCDEVPQVEFQNSERNVISPQRENVSPRNIQSQVRVLTQETSTYKVTYPVSDVESLEVIDKFAINDGIEMDIKSPGREAECVAAPLTKERKSPLRETHPSHNEAIFAIREMKQRNIDHSSPHQETSSSGRKTKQTSKELITDVKDSTLPVAEAKGFDMETEHLPEETCKESSIPSEIVPCIRNKPPGSKTKRSDYDDTSPDGKDKSHASGVPEDTFAVKDDKRKTKLPVRKTKDEFSKLDIPDKETKLLDSNRQSSMSKDKLTKTSKKSTKEITSPAKEVTTSETKMLVKGMLDSNRSSSVSENKLTKTSKKSTKEITSPAKEITTRETKQLVTEMLESNIPSSVSEDELTKISRKSTKEITSPAKELTTRETKMLVREIKSLPSDSKRLLPEVLRDQVLTCKEQSYSIEEPKSPTKESNSIQETIEYKSFSQTPIKETKVDLGNSYSGDKLPTLLSRATESPVTKQDYLNSSKIVTIKALSPNREELLFTREQTIPKNEVKQTISSKEQIIPTPKTENLVNVISSAEGIELQKGKDKLCVNREVSGKTDNYIVQTDSIIIIKSKVPVNESVLPLLDARPLEGKTRSNDVDDNRFGDEVQRTKDNLDLSIASNLLIGSDVNRVDISAKNCKSFDVQMYSSKTETILPHPTTSPKVEGDNKENVTFYEPMNVDVCAPSPSLSKKMKDDISDMSDISPISFDMKSNLIPKDSEEQKIMPFEIPTEKEFIPEDYSLTEQVSPVKVSPLGLTDALSSVNQNIHLITSAISNVIDSSGNTISHIDKVDFVENLEWQSKVKDSFDASKDKKAISESCSEVEKEISVPSTHLLTIKEAIFSGIVNPNTCYIVIGNERILLQKALHEKFVEDICTVLIKSSTEIILCGDEDSIKQSLAFNAAAMDENYKICEENTKKLLTWMQDIELKLADIGLIREQLAGVQHQINNVKLLKEEVEKQQHVVTTCLDQMRQLVQRGLEVLNKEEINKLQKNLISVKKQYDIILNECDRLLRRLIIALDELQKFKSELDTFKVWLTSTQHELRKKEVALGDLSKLEMNAEAFRVFSNDVIAHQADLRFITMAAQKFVDESQEYLKALNTFRANLPQHLPQIQASESEVKAEVQEVTTVFHNLLNHVNRLTDNYALICSKYRTYVEMLEKAKTWITSIKKSSRKVLEESVTDEPRVVQEQLDKIKIINMEIVGQGKLVENVYQTVKILTDTLENCNVTPKEMKTIESSVNSLQQDYEELMNNVSKKINELQISLFHSQDIQDGLDRIIKWVETTETTVKNNNKPISLINEKLDEQVQVFKILKSDIDNQRQSIDTLAASARDLVSSANPNLAKKIDGKLKDITQRFDKLKEKVSKRGSVLEEVSESLQTFEAMVIQFEEWTTTILERIESTDAVHQMDIDGFGSIIEYNMNQRNSKKDDFEQTVKIGKSLISKKDVTDVTPVKEKIKNMEQQWKNLGDILTEKKQMCKSRAEQMVAYDTLRAKILDWLLKMERDIEKLEPIALDQALLKKQASEITPLKKEFTEFSSSIDKINNMGNACDLMIRGESPKRKITSPVKKGSSPIRKSPSSEYTESRSIDSFSTSPVKGHVSAQSPLSTVSSGFSSRRSSADNIDFSPIHQQLSEINDRYTLLGTKIDDRSQEINTTVEELKFCIDNMKTFNVFIETKMKQLPKEGFFSKDVADKHWKSLKDIHEEMLEKQSELDHLKTKVNEMINKRKTSKGVSELEQELMETEKRWLHMSSSIKERLAFLQNLKDFQDSQLLLSNWLSQKQKMFQVLGPIASEPRMVSSQVQQVQVMRDEFSSQKSFLDRLNETGHVVLKYLQNTDVSAKKVKEQMDTISQIWDDLSQKLADREQNLEAASGVAKDFHKNLTELQEKLQQINDSFENLQEKTSSPEVLLQKLSEMEDVLEKERSRLTDADSVCEKLCDILSDSASKTEIRYKVSTLEKYYTSLRKKIDNRKAEIESSLKEDKVFYESCDDMQSWLQKTESNFTSAFYVSANFEKLQKQMRDYEPLYKQIMNKEHEVHLCLSKGSDMLPKITSKQELKNLKTKLDGIKTKWEKLKTTALERHTSLQSCLENCKNYHTAMEKLLPWLEGHEEKFKSLKPISFKRDTLNKQLKEIQTFRNDLTLHAQELENIQTLADGLLRTCESDKDHINKEVDLLKKKWKQLHNGVGSRVQALEDILQTLLEYDDKVRDVQHTVQRLEDRLVSHESLGDVSCDPLLLERMQVLLSETVTVKKQIKIVREFSKVVIGKAGQDSDVSEVLQNLNAIEKQHDLLSKKLEDRCCNLQTSYKTVTTFMDHVKTVRSELNQLDEKIDHMQPVARDKKALENQLKEIKDFNNMLSESRKKLSESELEFKNITKQGVLTDSKNSEEQIKNLKRQISRLEEHVRVREVTLENTVTKLKCFLETFTATENDLRSVLKEEEVFQSIGGDVDAIRSQQQAFKKFKNSRLLPLSKRMQEVNKLGQGLVQSASGGVDTTNLEKKLESLNESWNSLQESVNEREKKLDIALLQSGKFQEALSGVQKWLKDTEELVSNQKPPSSDFKVVKAQVQEQKFLKKMLLDRQNSVLSLKVMGNELMTTTKPTEQEQAENLMKNIGVRFEELITSAENRMSSLEKAIPVAQELQNVSVTITEWLEITEKKLYSMSSVPVEEQHVKIMIEDQKSIASDISKRKKSLDKLNVISEKLKEMISEEEAVGLKERVQSINDKFTEVDTSCKNVGLVLKEAQKEIGNFITSYTKVISWMEETTVYLTKFQVLSIHSDKLQVQLKDLKKLKEKLDTQQLSIENVITSGQEIMKISSGEDSIQMKEKLDALNMKLVDLSNRLKERLKTAEDSMPLIETFYSANKKLTSWLDSGERSMKSIDNSALDVQEEFIKKLQTEIQEYRVTIETINHTGPRLSQLSPGDGASVIQNLMSRANQRFDTFCEQVQRKAERIELAMQRKYDVITDIEELFEWFQETEKNVGETEGLTSEPECLATLLKEQKRLNEEINSQKTRVRDIITAAKKLMRESSTEDLSFIKEKMESLKTLTNNVATLCQERLGTLEQALPLAEHFFETHTDLVQWLDEVEGEAELLEAPALNPIQIKKQQDRNKGLTQSVQEHKPLVDKLNKTGSALTKLCREEDSEKLEVILESDNSRYNALRKILREHQSALEEALQATSQFSDKLEGMLSALTSTADQLHNAEPISAHPDRIQEQINDNKAVLQDLDKRTITLEAVKKAADDVVNKAGSIDEPAVRDIKMKLDRLNELWETIQTAARNRGKSLEEALVAAEKFWDELTAVMKALKELQSNLNGQDPPAVEPAAVQQQQEVLQEIKQEITQTKPEVDHCRQAGQNLMQLCGEPDKPEVKKHIEDLDSVWENVTTLYAKREQNLVDAMEKAMLFHDTLQNLLEFLDTVEEKFANLGAVSSDIDSVKSQIDQLKDFKMEVDPHMVEIESLNRQAQELMERTSPDQAVAIREPLADINKRWDDLLKGIVDRQQEMENTLLKLGQFQHALEELMIWMSKTEKTLDDLKPVFGDPQVIEVVLAKHKVITNDIQAHQTSMDTINRAGHQFLDSNHSSEDAKFTQNKLQSLNSRWQQLQDKASDRYRELEEALKEAQQFHQDIQDLLMWLNDIDSHLVTSKPVGGLPETAQEQLNRFMDVYNELDTNRYKVENVMQQGQDYMKRSGESSTKSLQHNLRTLKQRWDSILNKANDRKIKLEIALREATEFNEALLTFVEWLTSSEKYLTGLKPVSRCMKTVLEQIDDHRNFQKDVSAHREVMLNLDKKGTHLKYFSQKQDVILIKNLLISVQHRWERVVSKAAERTRALDHGYKESKEFHDAWTSLSAWLDEAEKLLDSTAPIGNDPAKIKKLLSKHKEFQRTLGAKQVTYDTTMKIGRALKEKSPKYDVQILQGMMDELKTRWNKVCSKSVDKQRKLEEALLYSGQFKEAVLALMDWFDKAIATLSDTKPYHGDLDTVTSLIDQHKAFSEELKNRGMSLETVRKTATDLKQSASQSDIDSISSQITELEERWKTVSTLSETRKRNLDEALRQAEELYKMVHILLEWLSDAEIKLRFVSPLPDDEETTKKQITEHESFIQELEKQELNKNKTLQLAEEILKKCHPDGISIIRHWITIIQSRWEEISLWAKQRDQRLRDHLLSLRDIYNLLEELLTWLHEAESTLTALEAEPLPDDLPVIETLIKEHQAFMDDMSKKQPDVERISKAFSTKRHGHKGLSQPPTKEKVKDKVPRSSTPVSFKSSLARSHIESDIKHPRAKLLLDKWRHVWLLAMERQRRLQDKYNYLMEVDRIKHFDFNEWRRRYLGWMNNKKSRIMDQFKKIDKNNDGKVTKQEFIDGILKSKFATSRLEMERVADIFDRNGDGFIDTKEYIETLRPDREGRPKTEAEKIQDEVQRQVAKCTCVHRFKVYQVGEGKYRFGDSQKLRLVRILRSTVMVRVGGGWVALDEFLVKNDPCRAKGRTNLELREKFILADGVSQSMTPFKPKTSPNSSVSSQSGTTSSMPSTGPITKIREKSERSTPMRRSRSSAENSDVSGQSFSETDSFGSKSGLSKTPSSSRLSPRNAVSKSFDRPSSRQGSRPSSRAPSDLSQDGIDEYKGKRKPVADGNSIRPNASNSVIGKTFKGASEGSKIPSVKKAAKQPEKSEKRK